VIRTFADLAPEHRLLVLSARPQVDDAAQAEIAELLDVIDWKAAIETAEAHGVTALVLKRFDALGLDVPAAITAAGRAYLAKQAARNKKLTDALKGILRALAGQGIDAIAFKGPVVARLAYGDAALRRYRDLDILVRERDADAACEALEALGFRNADRFTPAQKAAFRRYSGQDIVFRDGVAVEPHWALAPRTLSLDVDYDGLFARSRDIDLDGDAVRCFGAEDLVTVLCLHGSKEQWTRLLWIADLAHMICASPGLDWDMLLRRAREQGCLRMVLIGLALAAALLESLPAAVERAIADDPMASALAEDAASRLFDAGRADPSIYALSAFRRNMRERAADRVRYLVRTITTPRDIHFSLLRLPDALFFLYTPAKLVHDYALLPVWMLGKRLGRSQGG
jgi:Uncharacterised nucleotidyltransferase